MKTRADFTELRKAYNKVGSLISHAEALVEFGCEDAPIKAIGTYLDKLQEVYKDFSKG